MPEGYNVVVQGASRGIGLAFCRRLVADPRAGTIIATCRRPDDAGQLQALARSDHRIAVLPLDVNREDTIAQAAREVAGIVQTLHLVINCAGVLHTPDGLGPERRLDDVTADGLVESFRVNAAGPLLVAKHFAELLPRKGRAVFASVSARVGSIGDNRLGGWYGYRMAKAAQNMATRNLSIELKRRHRGIIAVGLHPGTTDTDLSKPFQKNVPDGKLFSPAQAVGYLLAVIDALESDDNGGFFAWDGKPIPW